MGGGLPIRQKSRQDNQPLLTVDKMSRLHSLKLFVQQRLGAAVEEIFAHFERTIMEYEEEVDRRHHKLLHVLSTPERKLRHEDVHQLLRTEEVPEQQQWSSGVDQEDPEPPHIKEEQEELWSSQEGEQLQGLEEADVTRFSFTPVPVKSEDDEEKPHQSPSEENTETQPPTSISNTSDGDEVCLSGFLSLKKNHVVEGETNNLFSCSECSKIFYQKHQLLDHMSVHAGEKPFSCSLCDKCFAHDSALKRHMRLHSREKPFDCPFCGKGFHLHSYLTRHMRLHTAEKTFICSICSKTFDHQNALKLHVSAHEEEKLRFTEQRQLDEHRCDGETSQLHQEDPEEKMETPPPTGADGDDGGGPEAASNGEPLSHDGKRFSCSKCGKGFFHEHQLNSHVRAHTRVCTVCGKQFSRYTNLKQHMMLHSGEKPFSCSFCSKRFLRRDVLLRHTHTHTQEKPFTCSACGDSFTQRAQLNTHMAGHSDVKWFSCSVCHKGFKSMYLLMRHIPVHQERRCHVCFKRFAHHHQLREHQCALRKQPADLEPLSVAENSQQTPPYSERAKTDGCNGAR